jgi:prepilin-type N-terminal cleavage/methylation domain-containing protein
MKRIAKVCWGCGRRQRGFSLLELILVVALLSIILGVVFRDIDTVQQRYRIEGSRLDLTQESREFLDQIVRDVRQLGQPNSNMYAYGVASTSPNSSNNAVGLVSISPTDLWFEGDVDQDNTGVASVRYTLQPDANGNCPCAIRRSQVPKSNGTAPTLQTLTYTTEVQNVINSNNTYTIAGTSSFGGVTVSNDTLYANYKTAPVFSAFDASGNSIDISTGLNINNNSATLKTIKTIQINLNVLATYNDMKTGLRPASALTANVRLNN